MQTLDMSNTNDHQPQTIVCEAGETVRIHVWERHDAGPHDSFLQGIQWGIRRGSDNVIIDGPINLGDAPKGQLIKGIDVGFDLTINGTTEHDIVLARKKTELWWAFDVRVSVIADDDGYRVTAQVPSVNVLVAALGRWKPGLTVDDRFGKTEEHPLDPIHHVISNDEAQDILSQLATSQEEIIPHLIYRTVVPATDEHPELEIINYNSAGGSGKRTIVREATGLPIPEND